MLPRLHRGLRDLGMQMMGKTNADRIDLRVFQEMTPVLMERNADHLAIAWRYDGIGYANHIQ